MSTAEEYATHICKRTNAPHLYQPVEYSDRKWAIVCDNCGFLAVGGPMSKHSADMTMNRIQIRLVQLGQSILRSGVLDAQEVPANA